MNIVGEKLILRAIEEKDLEILRDFINDPEIEKYGAGYSFPVSTQNQKQWYMNFLNNKSEIRVMIELKSGETVGTCSLTNIDWKNRCAFLGGIKIINKPELRGTGIGFETISIFMNYCFNELQLNRLEGSIIEYNVASRKLFIEKCGWKIEGVQRKKIYRNGRYHDNLIVAILKEDFEQWSEKIDI